MKVTNNRRSAIKRTASFLLPLLMVVLSDPAVAQSPSTPEGKQSLELRVDQVFAQWDKPHSPGCALGVIKDGRMIYERGYGLANLEHDIPISPTTAFYIGSTSKQFTAMSILLLAEQGKLSLDDDIRDYLPEIPPYDRPITIQHLIHHTSGVRDYLTLWQLAGRSFADSIPEEEALDLVARQKALNATPGQQFLYTNSGYFLLSLIVKRVSGKSLSEFAAENIFEPLGMRHTHFHDDRTRIVQQRATGHFRRQDGSFGIYTSSFDLVGSGGVYTTVEDLFLWDQNFYRNKLGKGDQTLIDKMLERGRLNNGKRLNYAFGLSVGEYKGLKMISHGGSFIGYKAELIRFPEQRFSVVVLCNLGNVNPSRLAKRVADIYLADQFTSTEPKTEAGRARPTAVSVDPAIYAAYLGKYELPSGAMITISKENDRLMAQITGQPKVELLPESETRFFLSVGGTRVSFRKGKTGKVGQLILQQHGQKLRARKIETRPLSPDRLADYVGQYYSSELRATYRVALDQGRLVLKVGYAPMNPLEHIRGDRFSAAGLKLLFIRNQQHKITGFALDAGRVKHLEFVRE